MTKKARSRACENCGEIFTEAYGDSNAQWAKREFCSILCNNTSKRRTTGIFERLERFQIRRDGCWGWSGTKDEQGYGRISSRDARNSPSPERAHRVSYEQAYGAIPDGLVICHRCDNPECTNPDHLFAGTQKDNMMDCSAKGRVNPRSLHNLRQRKKGFRGAFTEAGERHGARNQ